MPINKTPTADQNISFRNDIVNEFPDVAPHALSEFYGVDTPTVPTSGEIKFSDFCGAATKTLVTYSIIGGGGAGGFGKEDGNGGIGTFAQAGTNTTISSVTLGVITSNGGVGGENAAAGRGKRGTPGSSSTQGTGGLGGDLRRRGGSATGYGAGGGGAGGDTSSLFDLSGAGGLGGGASVTVTGSANIRYGETLQIVVGSKGIGSGGSYRGGDGSPGNCIISYNGQNFVFSANSTHVVTK